MLKNYLKIALRVLLKYKGYAFINVAGLAIGMACCVLILLFVRDELSYDDFHQQKENIFRVNLTINLDTGAMDVATTSPLIGPIMEETYPEVSQYVRLKAAEKTLLSYGDLQLYEERFFFADAALFAMFNFTLQRGNPETALTEPYSLVMTAATAARYFPGEDPIGKVLRYENTHDYKITGILDEVPANSHLKFDCLASYNSLNAMAGGNFEQIMDISGAVTYLLLSDPSRADALQEQFPNLIATHMTALGDQATSFFQLSLEPLAKIHLYDDLANEIAEKGNITYIYIFLSIAFFILVIACINFMNLATARSMDRAREVGIRKVLGAVRWQLIRQFLGEAFVMAALSLLLTIVLVELILPYFNTLAEKELSLNYIGDPQIWIGLLGITLLVGGIAGIYPALALSSFQPVDTLKGSSKMAAAKATGKQLFSMLGVRKTLVVFQFSISIMLIIATLVVWQQMQYFQEKELGLNSEQIITVPIREAGFADKYDLVKKEISRIPGVVSVAAMSEAPGKNDKRLNSIRPEDMPPDAFVTVQVNAVDTDFLNTFDIGLVEGRDFSRELTSDSSEAVIINETLAKMVGWNDNALGKKIFWGSENRSRAVIGVVRDYHHVSLQVAIDPMMMVIDQSNFDNLAIKIGEGNLAATLSALERQWQQLYPNYPFEYTFVNDDFASQYESETRLSKVFLNFAIIAIVVACLGLFGLTAFSARQRSKEIGVRKVLGASVGSVVTLIARDFLLLVLLANLIAWPLAWLGMDYWLQEFAYRINPGVGTFLLAGGAALLIALLTVSYQSIKAALANPVDALKYE